MKKSLFLSIMAGILLAGVIFGIWYINKQGIYANNTRDLFVPNRSDLVINTTSQTVLSSKIRHAFAKEIRAYKEKFIHRSVDTLRTMLKLPSYGTIAVSLEGRSDLSFLYIMENKSNEHRNEIGSFFKGVYGAIEIQERKYDKYRIYGLKQGKQAIYYAVEEGMILLSDSELFIEDAFKQFEKNEEKSDFKNIDQYFSAGAGLNVYVNKDFFSRVLPLYIQAKNVFKDLDITQLFDWGAFDGEADEKGVMLNGFMSYEGTEASYMKTLKLQKPKEILLDRIIPTNAVSFTSLNLTDLKAYLTDLDRYRYHAGSIETVRKRKQDYKRSLGNGAELDLKELLQGEFALVDMGYDENNQKYEGAVVASLKSGSLCRSWLETLIGTNARYKNVHPDSYQRTYKVDREKSFHYYFFPEEDFADICWGPLFGNVRSKYVFITDNHFILASSEKVIVDFARTYMHNYSLKDVEWYKSLRLKLSAKFNLAYFSNVINEYPYFCRIAKGKFSELLSQGENMLLPFSGWAMQWGSEADMLYSIIYLHTEQVEPGEKPYLLWQTKLDARMSMKPATVMNHDTGEREFLIQDDNHVIYLVNNSGRILWKQAIEGRINSEVFQIDALKNGKLQYLFSTPDKMYLIDRNGNPVGRFPVSFRASCQQGITVFDYDKKRDYRIFAPCLDREVYLYDEKGEIVKGWQSERTDKEIVSKVKFFRIGAKDYVVYADKHRIYIRDRKGKERIKVASVFDLPDEMEFYLTTRLGKSAFAFPDLSGVINVVDFSGNCSVIACKELGVESNMNVGDINGDFKDDFIVTSGHQLSVYDHSGKQIYSKDLKVGSLGFPYIYRFSNSDIRIGLLGMEKGKMLLFNPEHGTSKGFPIDGDSPFSIVFGQSGEFFLFAGAGNGNFMKYRVQR